MKIKRKFTLTIDGFNKMTIEKQVQGISPISFIGQLFVEKDLESYKLNTDFNRKVLIHNTTEEDLESLELYIEQMLDFISVLKDDLATVILGENNRELEAEITNLITKYTVAVMDVYKIYKIFAPDDNFVSEDIETYLEDELQDKYKEGHFEYFVYSHLDKPNFLTLDELLDYKYSKKKEFWDLNRELKVLHSWIMNQTYDEKGLVNLTMRIDKIHYTQREIYRDLIEIDIALNKKIEEDKKLDTPHIEWDDEDLDEIPF